MPSLPCDCEVAFERWNVMAAKIGMPEAQLLGKPRRRAIELRLKEDLGGLAGWDAMLAKIEGSSSWFRTEFRPGLDWVLKPANLTKVMEGNYDDSSSTQSGLGAVLAELGRLGSEGIG